MRGEAAGQKTSVGLDSIHIDKPTCMSFYFFLFISSFLIFFHFTPFSFVFIHSIFVAAPKLDTVNQQIRGEAGKQSSVGLDSVQMSKPLGTPPSICPPSFSFIPFYYCLFANSALLPPSLLVLIQLLPSWTWLEESTVVETTGRHQIKLSPWILFLNQYALTLTPLVFSIFFNHCWNSLRETTLL